MNDRVRFGRERKPERAWAAMSADRRTKTTRSDEEMQEPEAHQEAVEDALHQADYVRRFIEFVGLCRPHEIRIEHLFWPVGISRN